MSSESNPDLIQNLINFDCELDSHFQKLDIYQQIKDKQFDLVSSSTLTQDQIRLLTNKHHSDYAEFFEETQPHVSTCGNEYGIHIQTKDNDNSSKVGHNDSDDASRRNVPQQLQKDESHQEVVVSSDEEHSLNEFVTHNTEMRIKFLKKKSGDLQNALSLTQEKIKNMNSQINNANKLAKDASKEALTLKKALSSKEALLKKKEKEYKELMEELSKKNEEYHMLFKDYCHVEKKLKEERRHQTFVTQNKNLKLKLNEVQDKLADEVVKNKEREQVLRAKISENKEREKELQRHLLSLSAVVEKQEELISVLQQQKASIATARMTKSLEKELVSLIHSFSANEQEGSGSF